MYEWTNKQIHIKVYTKPILNDGNNWLHPRSVSFALRNTQYAFVYWVWIWWLQTILVCSSHRSTKPEKTHHTFQLHITFVYGFLFPRFMRSQWNKSTGWTKRVYKQLRKCVLLLHINIMLRSSAVFFCCVSFYFFPLLFKCIHFYFPVQCSIHTYFSIHSRSATFRIPSGRWCEKDRHGLNEQFRRSEEK